MSHLEALHAVVQTQLVYDNIITIVLNILETIFVEIFFEGEQK